MIRDVPRASRGDFSRSCRVARASYKRLITTSSLEDVFGAAAGISSFPRKGADWTSLHAGREPMEMSERKTSTHRPSSGVFGSRR
jgi:hypothetical protein